MTVFCQIQPAQYHDGVESNMQSEKGLIMSLNKDANAAAAEVAAAEAELKAAQEKLAAAKAKLADGDDASEEVACAAVVVEDADGEVVEAVVVEAEAAPSAAADDAPMPPAPESAAAETAPQQTPPMGAEPSAAEPTWVPYSTNPSAMPPTGAPYGAGTVPPPAGYTAPGYGAAPSQTPHAGPGAVPPQQPYYGYQQPYYQQPYTQPVVSTKDHVAAGLLAIFLGTLGIHKFYLGYNVAGFIMLAVTVLGSLVTFGLAGAVMWVISIIEGILYLTKSQSEFEQIYVLNKREWF